jgi:hypothetical protein
VRGFHRGCLYRNDNIIFSLLVDAFTRLLLFNA